MDGPFWGVLTHYGPGTALTGTLVLLIVFILRAYVGKVLSGDLVPRSTLDAVREDCKAHLEEVAKERDGWKQAHAASEETRQLMGGQYEKLVEGNIVAKAILDQIKERLP